MDPLSALTAYLAELPAGSFAAFVGIVWLTWIGLAVLVGWVAGRRGQGMPGWFLLALLTSPFVAGLVLVLLTPRRPPRGYR